MTLQAPARRKRKSADSVDEEDRVEGALNDDMFMEDQESEPEEGNWILYLLISKFPDRRFYLPGWNHVASQPAQAEMERSHGPYLRLQRMLWTRMQPMESTESFR